MDYNIGFIGMGNMALAIASGLIKHGGIDASKIYGYAPNQDKLVANAKSVGFTPCQSIQELVSRSEILVMACKPYQIEKVLQEIYYDLKGKALLSIAAGWDFARYSSLVDKSTRVQFIMPNTPVMVGEGVFLFEDKNSLLPEERKDIMELFSSMGVVQELPSRLMGIGGTITGCGPAFIDMLMEGFGDAAVKYGIQRGMAYRLIAQMVLGSAKLQLETEKHPGVLKDEVCSPGGTTILGVEALERAGFPVACMDAVKAIMER
jgi:pyrroline-5-carboxylate reductase